ncbi:RDD family protein [Natrarchaeobius sp. A-rgal3]|uniref:RDD family protein n=1 Tax=Natrarchaeobius versutus TaxID=1679078 RepID=UPI00350F9443
MLDRHPSPVSGTEDEVLVGRIGAYVVDSIVVFGGVVFLFATTAVASTALQAVSELLSMAIVFVGITAMFVFFIYYVFMMEGHFGRTPGKALFGLVVVKEDGSKCTMGASVVRNFLWLIDSFGFWPLVVAVICFFTDRNQRVGDMVAKTVVLRAKRK